VVIDEKGGRTTSPRHIPAASEHFYLHTHPLFGCAVSGVTWCEAGPEGDKSKRWGMDTRKCQLFYLPSSRAPLSISVKSLAIHPDSHETFAFVRSRFSIKDVINVQFAGLSFNFRRRKLCAFHFRA
jgi:hypothetical protein